MKKNKQKKKKTRIMRKVVFELALKNHTEFHEAKIKWWLYPSWKNEKR